MRILLALKTKYEGTKKIGDTLVQLAKQEDGISLTYDIVLSEVAIRNKMSEDHYDAVIVMITLENRPLTIDKLTSISEIDEETKLIIVMDKVERAKGSEFCQSLLQNNLIYGVYFDDAKVTMLYNLIKNGRTRSEARAYYGLVLNPGKAKKLRHGVVPEEIRSMTDYITNGNPDIEETLEERVNYMAKHCSEEEKEAVFASLSEEMREKVRAIPAYAKYFFDSSVSTEEAKNYQAAASKDETAEDADENEADDTNTIKDTPEPKEKVVPIDTKDSEPAKLTALPKKEKKTEKQPDPKTSDNSILKTAEQVAKKAATGAVSGIKNIKGIFSKPADKKTELAKEKSSSAEPSKLISRRVIGVIGAYSGAGTTTTAVSLAKTISKYEPVTMIEMPRNGMNGIYETYSLDKNIGPGYKSVPHMIAADEKDLSRVSNMYEGINFFVPNSSYGYETLSNEQLALMLNGTPDNVVIDLGSSLEEACSSGLVNLLTHMVLVFANSNAEKHLSKIKSDVSQIEFMNLVPVIICVEDKGTMKIPAIGDVRVIRTKSVIGSKVIPLGLSAIDKKVLLETIGVSSSGRHVIKTQKRTARGVVDIAVAGTRSGIGTTYTTLLLADSLRKSYKVAYFEYNNTGDMQHLASEYNSDDPNHLSINGVDIFYDMDYAEFANTYRSDYDYVFIDFGTLGKIGKRKEVFSSCSKKFICIPSAPWRVFDLDYDVDAIDELDPNGSIQLLAPLATKKTIKNYNLYKRCGRREIIPVPFAEEPLGNKEIIDYLSRLF